MLMSCYAFFKRWLPLGQLIRIKKTKHPCTLKNQLGILADDLGCFPFDTGPSRPMSDLPFLFKKLSYFSSLIRSFTVFKGVC